MRPAARLLGLNITDIAAQLQAALVGVTGGSMVEGTDQMPIRVRLTDAVQGEISAMADLPILMPNAAELSAQGLYPAVPLSELARPVVEAAESVITRRNGGTRQHRASLYRARRLARRGAAIRARLA